MSYQRSKIMNITDKTGTKTKVHDTSNFQTKHPTSQVTQPLLCKKGNIQQMNLRLPLTTNKSTAIASSYCEEKDITNKQEYIGRPRTGNTRNKIASFTADQAARDQTVTSPTDTAISSIFLLAI